jgi:hypothetical protein
MNLIEAQVINRNQLNKDRRPIKSLDTKQNSVKTPQMPNYGELFQSDCDVDSDCACGLVL